MKKLILTCIGAATLFFGCMPDTTSPVNSCADPGTADQNELRWCDTKVNADTAWGQSNATLGIYMIRVDGTGPMGKYLYSIYLPGKDAPTTNQTYEVIQQTINIPAGKAYVGATVPINSQSQDVYRCRTGEGTVQVNVNNGKYEVIYSNVTLENNYNNAEVRKASVNAKF